MATAITAGNAVGKELPLMADSTAPPREANSASADTHAIIERHRPLVRKIAHRLKKRLPDHHDLQDLEAWGYAGLLEAYRRFDDSRGNRFATFAYYRIRGAILDALQDSLADPHRQRCDVACNEVLNLYAHQVHCRESVRSLEGQASDLSDVCGSMLMVYALNDCASNALRAEAAPHHKQLARKQRATLLRRLIKQLPDNEREVIEGVYLRDETMTHVAESLDLSLSWVSRIHSRALKKLKKLIQGDSDFQDLRNPLPI